MQALREGAPIRFDKTFEMPSIPVVLGKIIQVLDDNESSARDLEELILHDPSLSARILKLANSAFYSFRSEVKTLSHAIPLLGMNLVKSLAIGVNIFESFIKGTKSEAALIHKLWMHSFGTALISQEIWTRRATAKEGEFAFLCGLLHDLGKVVFFKKDAAAYSNIFAREKGADDADISTCEMDRYGLDHAMVGSMLATHWRLPSDLSTVILKHHDALKCGVPLAAAVSLADLVAKQSEIGYDGDRHVASMAAALVEHLHATPKEFEALLLFASERRGAIEDFFRLP